VRNRHQAGCRVAVERAADRYTLICDGPHNLSASRNGFFATVNALLETNLWAAMERINTMNACQFFFMACGPNRPKQSYTIDFSTTENYFGRTGV